MNVNSAMVQRQQLSEQRRKVDFDTYDVTVDELIRRVERFRIEVAPVYQRQFRWDEARQSKLIESLLLGIPVPPLFMATNVNFDEQVQWEVVDGLQRLLTLVNFAGGDDARRATNLKQPILVLRELDKLTSINGSKFADLPQDIRSSLEDRPVKVIVLNDKSDLQVRFDLFERLNTGGVKLTDQEVRECVYRGEFMDCIVELSLDENFMKIVHLPAQRWKDGTPQDYTLRFFAFLEKYMEFKHSVKEFLNEFAGLASDIPDKDRRSFEFRNTFRFLSLAFPHGIKTRKGMTPVNLFEAVAVGAALALRLDPHLVVPDNTDWLQSDTLRKLTTGPTNSTPRVRGRIEYCRDAFLGVVRV